MSGRGVLLALAGLVTSAWWLLGLLGGRAAARVVTGGALRFDEAVVGAAYVATHLALVVLVPSCLLAALLLTAWSALDAWRARAHSTASQVTSTAL